jgi:hypothetical protein
VSRVARRVVSRVDTYVTDLSAVEVRAATMPGRDALRVGDADELAEIAVDAMIASARKMGIRPG